MTVAVILAGGSGSRMGAGGALDGNPTMPNQMPKQFLTMAGKRVIEYSLDAFEQNALIDEICVVCRLDYMHLLQPLAEQRSSPPPPWSKLRRILPGGKERYLSSLAAINAYSDNYSDDTRVVFHDAARPLVSQRIITDTVKALDKWRAVAVASKTTDTIISVDGDGTVRSILDRSCLYNAQTPQAFRLGVIKKAYEIALNDSTFKPTDDCAAVCAYLPDEPIFVVQGEASNIKITYKEDIFLCEKLLQSVNGGTLSGVKR